MARDVLSRRLVEIYGAGVYLLFDELDLLVDLLELVYDRNGHELFFRVLNYFLFELFVCFLEYLAEVHLDLLRAVIGELLDEALHLLLNRKIILLIGLVHILLKLYEFLLEVVDLRLGCEDLPLVLLLQESVLVQLLLHELLYIGLG